MFRLVVGDGLKLTGIGVALGIGASLIVARWLTTLLFDVRPGDPWTLAATAGVLLVGRRAGVLSPGAPRHAGGSDGGAARGVTAYEVTCDVRRVTCRRWL